MMSQTGRESAKIIPFRSKARTASGDPRVQSAAVVALRPQPIAYCEFGSGGYHEAAIVEDQPGRKA